MERRSITWQGYSEHISLLTLAELTSHSAGIKDSALTSHGHLQAERLGQYFAERSVHFTHVFSSDLQRAYKTATAICTAQPSSGDNDTSKRPCVLPLKVLREQDFGSYEGKPFHFRSRDSNKTVKDVNKLHHQNDPDFKDEESKNSMIARMAQFLREHLLPVLKEEQSKEEATVAIVSHGIILSYLWRCFLNGFPKNSVALSPGLSVGTGNVTFLEFLGGWSNTGYLELQVLKGTPAMPDKLISPSLPPLAAQCSVSSIALLDYRMVIKAVNGKEHLAGLKRTRGVGSSQYDEGQKKIDSFFKKPKV